MNNSQRAVMLGAGLFIIVIIVAAVLLILTRIVNFKGEFPNISKEIQEEIIKDYEGQLLKGEDVIATCKKYENSEASVVVHLSDDVNAYTGKYKLSYSEIKENKSGGFYYIETISGKTNDSKIELSKLEDNSSELKISEDSNFYSYIIKYKDTETVVGILFVKENLK